MQTRLIAGAAAIDITPFGPVFLFGYPRVERISTGVHDPLLSSTLYLSDGLTSLLLISCDVIFISRAIADRARTEIASRSNVPAAQILISATHTHSGPLTVEMVSNAADPIVPRTDARYLDQLIAGIVESALAAIRNAAPCELALSIADGSCVGTNRHDPSGPSDPETPVLVVRDQESKSITAMMIVCSMHPTVLHEDSPLISGDFPAMAREYLQQNVVGRNCPIIYHSGVCGNLSPRHVTRANTFEEAKRLGQALGKAIETSLAAVEYIASANLDFSRTFLELPVRTFPTVSEAEQILAQAEFRFESLTAAGADHREIRSAECDWFGAEETLTLSKASVEGQLSAAIAASLPAELTRMQIGPWTFIGWPGELFVEFALEVKRHFKNCFIISLANGELQGYLVTQEAVQRGVYEAGNAVFSSPESGRRIVEQTLELIRAQ